nr:YdaS family helix-turn-helix protein [Psychrobacter sp. PraFG1]UNK04744.1 helix-turn-helix domain-containing protein [Psychrobacter sp. PraFG1]
MNIHIESLKRYVSELGSETEREEFAERCGTTLGHLRQIYYGNRTCDAGLAIEIENTNQAVMCEELRSDIDFAYLRNLSPQPEEA